MHQRYGRIKLSDRKYLANIILLLPQILILSDPEVESSLLISSDEGATFQKFNINFYIMSLLFHPTQENWILAYSHDQRVHTPTHTHIHLHSLKRFYFY